MISIAIGDYTISIAESLPEPEDRTCQHAALIERIALEADAGPATGDLHIHVGRESWPLLCVAQRYSPTYSAGYQNCLLLVPETHILFIGAGDRILAYDLREPARLWEDRADVEFHAWRRHGDVVVMSAELELAAWDLHGSKLWPSAHLGVFVEPPWEYRVEGDTLHLDVMGNVTSFPLHTGP